MRETLEARLTSLRAQALSADHSRLPEAAVAALVEIKRLVATPRMDQAGVALFRVCRRAADLQGAAPELKSEQAELAARSDVLAAVERFTTIARAELDAAGDREA